MRAPALIFVSARLVPAAITQHLLTIWVWRHSTSRFGGEDDGGIYHSIYDDFYWFTHFSDKDFVYGRALSQTVGTMVLRFADADVLPYDFADFADTIHKYNDELKKLLKDKQEQIHDRNQDIDDGVYSAVSDPRRPTVAPPKEEVPSFLNFAPLDNAQNALDRSSQRYSKALKSFNSATVGHSRCRNSMPN